MCALYGTYVLFCTSDMLWLIGHGHFCHLLFVPRHNRQIVTFRVEQDEGDTFSLGEEKFDSFQDLLSHYRDQPIPTNDSDKEIYLMFPVHVRQAPLKGRKNLPGKLFDLFMKEAADQNRPNGCVNPVLDSMQVFFLFLFVFASCMSSRNVMRSAVSRAGSINFVLNGFLETILS